MSNKKTAWDWSPTAIPNTPKRPSILEANLKLASSIKLYKQGKCSLHVGKARGTSVTTDADTVKKREQRERNARALLASRRRTAATQN